MLKICLLKIALIAISKIDGLNEKEILGVVGESGSGKTLLSQAIVNWLPENLEISSGHIDFLGKKMNEMSENELEKNIRGREIAYIGPNAINSLD